MSDIQKFVTNVFMLCNELAEERLLSPKDITIILDSISKLNKPAYKNSTAYVIGYIVSGGGRNFTYNNFKTYFNNKIIKQYLEEKDIDCSVIIRYARLWTNII